MGSTVYCSRPHASSVWAGRTRLGQQAPAARQVRLSSCLRFASALARAVIFVMPQLRKRRQPRFTPRDPVFVGRRELGRRVERPKVNLDFVVKPGKYRRPALRTEVSPSERARFAGDRHGMLREDCRCEEQGPVVLAAIKAMAKANPVWLARRKKTNLAA